MADERARPDLRRPAEQERGRAQAIDPGGGRPGIGLGDVAEAIRPGLERRELEVGPDGGRGVVLGVDVIVAAEPAPLLRGEPAPQPGPNPDLSPLLCLHVHLQRLVIRPAPQGDRGATRRHLHGEARLGEEAAVGVDAPPGAVGVAAVARGDDHANRQGHRPVGCGPIVLDMNDDPRRTGGVTGASPTTVKVEPSSTQAAKSRTRWVATSIMNRSWGTTSIDGPAFRFAPRPTGPHRREPRLYPRSMAFGSVTCDDSSLGPVAAKRRVGQLTAESRRTSYLMPSVARARAPRDPFCTLPRRYVAADVTPG